MQLRDIQQQATLGPGCRELLVMYHRNCYARPMASWRDIANAVYGLFFERFVELPKSLKAFLPTTQKELAVTAANKE